jgi:hypothetical protein
MVAQMATEHQVVTANRLSDGRVVYLDPQGDWTEDLSATALAEHQGTADALLARAAVDEASARVVAPYLIAVRLFEGRRWPLRTREVLRAAGPSVGSSLGASAL